VRQKQLRNTLLLFLLAVSDYKWLDTCLYFIITNFHTELKPQAKVSHDMNFLTLTLHTTFDLLWTIGKPHCFDQLLLKTEVR